MYFMVLFILKLLNIFINLLATKSKSNNEQKARRLINKSWY